MENYTVRAKNVLSELSSSKYQTAMMTLCLCAVCCFCVISALPHLPTRPLQCISCSPASQQLITPVTRCLPAQLSLPGSLCYL